MATHPLLTLQESIRQQIASIDTAMERTKGHKPDVSTEQAMVENNRAIVHRLNMRLMAIDAAVARLKGGSYGICPDCGENISSARLEAVPEALRCIPCHEIS